LLLKDREKGDVLKNQLESFVEMASLRVMNSVTVVLEMTVQTSVVMMGILLKASDAHSKTEQVFIAVPNRAHVVLMSVAFIMEQYVIKETHVIL
jgi:hypothetical protein